MRVAGGRGAAAASLVLAAALAAGCQIKPDPIHVRSVQLVGAASAALVETGLDPAGVEAAARAALADAGFVVGDGTRPHAAGVDVESVRVLPGGAAGPRAEVTVELVLAPVGGGSVPPRRARASAAVALSSTPSPREAFRLALAEATRRAARGLALGVRAEEKGEPALVADLGASDARVREEAIRVLAERRSRAAVPALVARLRREEPRMVHRIVGALAQIGDERAVPALIDAASGADPGLVTRLVRFVGDIGGAEAEGYLLTLASGHPDPAVRGAAREALDDLAARAKDPVAARK